MQWQDAPPQRVCTHLDYNTGPEVLSPRPLGPWSPPAGAGRAGHRGGLGSKWQVEQDIRQEWGESGEERGKKTRNRLTGWNEGKRDRALHEKLLKGMFLATVSVSFPFKQKKKIKGRGDICPLAKWTS